MITHYKNKRVYRSAHKVPWHSKLLDVNEWIFEQYERLYYTSTYRPMRIHAKDSGIHSTIPLRAEDLRSRVYPLPGKRIAREINAEWIYDPERPRLKVALFHSVKKMFNGQAGRVHFHIQVHDRTCRRLA